LSASKRARRTREVLKKSLTSKQTVIENCEKHHFSHLQITDRGNQKEINGTELLSVDSMKYEKQDYEEEKLLPSMTDNKNKISKMNKENLSKFNDIQNKKLREEGIDMKNQKQSAIFKVTKVNNKKESSQESDYNISSEERRNVILNYAFMKKYSKEGSDRDSNLSTKGTTNYICLDGGKIIIKGNEIETVVP